MSILIQSNNLFRTVKSLKPVGDYVLRTKINRLKVSEFHLPGCRIPEGATEFGYVNVGKISDNSFVREIITFFDESGKLLQHIFKTNNEEVSKRNYSYPKKGMRVIDFYSESDEKVSTEIQKIAITDEGKKNQSKQFLTKRINYLKSKSGSPIWQIIFTHFPKIGQQKVSQKQVASAEIIDRNGQKVLTKFRKSGFCGTFDISDKDDFLLTRFLGINTNEGILALTKKYLKRKRLSELNIKINPSSSILNKNTEAEFFVDTRTISFNPILKAKLPSDIVNAIAHEVEHAYQYSMIGRLGKGRSSYETDAHRMLGDLNLSQIGEAIKYADAKADYPRYVLGEDISKNPRYLTNYLEVKAREAGKQAEGEYTHLNPSNYLFFDWAFQ